MAMKSTIKIFNLCITHTVYAHIHSGTVVKYLKENERMKAENILLIN